MSTTADASEETSEESEPRAAAEPAARFGTFEGVFVPTTLTILGVILFLRTGWVVGEVGLGGALLVIGAAYTISTCTALSMSSIVTNMRIGPGGAFSVITKTLGIELGGSIGVPLYLSQALAAAMYIFGFREGWRWIFPEHPALLVDVTLFVVLFTVAAISARLAFRVQYAILAIITVSVGALVAGVFTGGFDVTTTWWPEGQDHEMLTKASFWTAFAVFFPAVTGIMAGANMSGELERPDRSIPRGTLWAIGLTFAVYAGVAWMLSRMGTMEELRANQTIMIDVALWSPVVLGGLLAATFSSALSVIVGAPRILQALARRRIVPKGEWLAHISDRGEPLRALGATAVIVGLGVAMRSLNQIAELITLFFLLTYGAINVTLLIQQGFRLSGFRPRFRVPLIVPLVGTLGCIAAMFVIHVGFAFAAIVAVIGVHTALARRKPEGPFGQVRSGLMLDLAEWVVKRLGDVPRNRRNAWLANLLVPVRDEHTARAAVPMLGAIAGRGGSATMYGLADADNNVESLGDALAEVKDELEELTAVRCVTQVIDEGPVESVSRTLSALRTALLSPNLLVLPVSTLDEAPSPWIASTDAPQEALDELTHVAKERNFGLALFGLGERVRDSDEGPYSEICVAFDGDLEPSVFVDDTGASLLVISAWKMHRAWDVDVTFMACTVREDENEHERSEPLEARHLLDDLMDMARIPGADGRVCYGDIKSCVDDMPADGLLLVALPTPVDLESLREIHDSAHCDVLFVCLSGEAEAAG